MGSAIGALSASPLPSWLRHVRGLCTVRLQNVLYHLTLANAAHFFPFLAVCSLFILQATKPRPCGEAASKVAPTNSGLQPHLARK